MRRIRVIPSLLIENGKLVKTVRFGKRTYIGDPVNAVKIFNDKEVDELLLLDIGASPAQKEPNFKLVREIAGECFMPLAYGGGIANIEQARRIFGAGVEKVVLNSALHTNPALVGEIARIYGSQAVIASIDVRRGRFLARPAIYTHGGTRKVFSDPITIAKRAVDAGAGEILLVAIDRDGMMEGYDVDLLAAVAGSVSVPVIAGGGAGKLSHFVEAIRGGQASAVSAGAMFVFKGPHRAVLISYPSQTALKDEVYSRL